MTNKFQVGDVVRVKCDCNICRNCNLIEAKGIVVAIKKFGRWIYTISIDADRQRIPYEEHMLELVK